MIRNTITSLNQTALGANRLLLISKQDIISAQINQQSVRYARGIKPWKNGPMEDWKNHIYNYEYRKERAKKVLKVKLPDIEKTRNTDMDHNTPDQLRSQLKERGVVANRKWMEKPLYIGDSGRVLDEYVPAEGEGKASIISKEGVTQKAASVSGRGKDMWHVRKVKNYIDMFDPQDFALNEAIRIYIKAHEALAEQNLRVLSTVVTETCLPNMLFSTDLKTIRWKYLKALEPPRVVNVKVDDSEIAFGQVTVRFHTQQILAVYDKLGRLVHGSEAIVKDVLDYIVFENRLSSLHGVWRIHSKIIPEWLKSKHDLSSTTMVLSESDQAQ